MKLILLNVALALCWATLNDDYGLPTLVVGYAIGWALLLLLRRTFADGTASTFRLSPRKLWYSAAYTVRLIFEILLAGLVVTRSIIRWKTAIRPGIIVVPADVKGDVEVTLLANSITLTPGTWTLDIPNDRRALYVHALDVQEPEQTKADIKQRLEKFILRASRC